MRLRRLVVVMALAVGMGLAAEPATAATVSPDCAEPGGQVVITVAQGETVTLISSSGTPCTWSGTNVPTYADWFSSYTGGVGGDVGDEPFVWVISASAPLGQAAPDTAQFCVGSGDLMQDPRTCFILNVVAPGAIAPAQAVDTTPVDTTPVPDWLQAYGRIGPNASCEVGWSPSWQEWAQAVTGGWVCTRSLPSYG